MKNLPILADPATEGAHCDLCPLSTRGKIVPPQRPASPLKFVVVGEGPGLREENLRTPFIGPSGQLLDTTLREAGLSRTDAYVTNATLCRPDGDWDAEAATMCCAPRLYRELQEFKHLPVLTLGKLATRAVLGTGSILMVRGFLWETPVIDEAHVKAARREALKVKKNPEAKAPGALWAKVLQAPTNRLAYQVKRLRYGVLKGRASIAGIKLIPTIHPAFVLRMQTWAPALRVDIARFGRMVRGELGTPTDQGPHRVSSDPKVIRAALQEMGDTIAFDIETDGVDPLRCEIRCVGLADGVHTPLVIFPWMPSIHAPLLTEAFNAEHTIDMEIKNDSIRAPRLCGHGSKTASRDRVVGGSNGSSERQRPSVDARSSAGGWKEGRPLGLLKQSSHVPDRQDGSSRAKEEPRSQNRATRTGRKG